MRKSVKVLIEKAEAVIGGWEEAHLIFLDAPDSDQYHQGICQSIEELKEAIKKVKGEQ